MQMAVTASNGGLLPWQSGWTTPIGRFQFVFGRELGVTFFGLTGADRLFVPSGPRAAATASRLQVKCILICRSWSTGHSEIFQQPERSVDDAALSPGVTVPYCAECDPACGRARRGSQTRSGQSVCGSSSIGVLSMTAFTNLQKSGGDMRTSRTLRILTLGVILAIVLISGAAKATEDPAPIVE